MDQKTFLYFGYGSNLLKARIIKNNKSAQFKCIGKLRDYKLEFAGAMGEKYCGAGANITQQDGQVVHGCVWLMHHSDMDNLDQQEGVSHGIYKPIQVNIETTDGAMVSCRTYTFVRPDRSDPRPCPQYLSVILKGARENGLPDEYVSQLEKVEHNNFSGPTIYDSFI